MGRPFRRRSTTRGSAGGAYQVLARRARPQTFADVVGQAPVPQPLTNALDSLSRLQGVSFEWVNPADHAGQTGPQGGFGGPGVYQMLARGTVPGGMNMGDPQFDIVGTTGIPGVNPVVSIPAGARTLPTPRGRPPMERGAGTPRRDEMAPPTRH